MQPPRVPEALNDLFGFVHRADLPVLTQVAIAHAQFETIHPFDDGNGRVGRTLVHAMLRRSGVTHALTIPACRGSADRHLGYFRALSDYREGYLNPIIHQFVGASFRAIGNGRALVNDAGADLRRVGRTAERAAGLRSAPAAAPPAGISPAITVSSVETTTGRALSAAQHAVEQLENADILARTGGNRRNRVWIASDHRRARRLR